jgi:hypothetical protein
MAPKYTESSGSPPNGLQMDRTAEASIRQFTFNLRLTLWLRFPLDALTMIV